MNLLLGKRALYVRLLDLHARADVTQVLAVAISSERLDLADHREAIGPLPVDLTHAVEHGVGDGRS